MSFNTDNDSNASGIGKIITQVAGQEIKTTPAPDKTTIDSNNPKPDEKQGDLQINNPNAEFSKYEDASFTAFEKDFINSKFETKDGLFINKNGDLVNEKKEIVLSKSDLVKESKVIETSRGEAVTKFIDFAKGGINIELNGQELLCTIDENGNLINDKKEIVLGKDKFTKYVSENYTNDQIDSIINGDDEDEHLVEAVSKLSGYQVVDEDGNPLEFENSIEGLAKWNHMLVQQEAVNLANEKLENFITEIPDLLDAINYARINKSLEGYTPYKDYSAITVDPKDEQACINLIVEAETSIGGRTKEYAMSLAKMFKDNNLLEKMAKESLTSLNNHKQNLIAKRQQEADSKQQEAIRIRQENESKIKNIVTKGELMQFRIPETIKVKQDNGVIKNVSREDFIHFVTKPIQNGFTADQILQTRDTLEQKLLMSYLRFTGMDLTQLIKSFGDSKKVADMRATKQSLKLGNRLKINTENSTGNKLVVPIVRT
jgi:predicted XRE-type DNA-binding protein